jgi:hypothetical protein
MLITAIRRFYGAKMNRSENQFDEYSLPGDEPLKHQWDTNVQFDWLRHQPKNVQARLPKEPGAAWDSHVKDLELEHQYDKEIHAPIHESLQPRGRIVPLPGKSLRSYYSKKKK